MALLILGPTPLIEVKAKPSLSSPETSEFAMRMIYLKSGSSDKITSWNKIPVRRQPGGLFICFY